MRVALLTGSKTYWLAGEPKVSERDFSSAANIDIDEQIATQIDEFVRAPEVSIEDRLNLKTTLTFSTVRKFASAHAAELWSQDYSTAFPRKGTVLTESVEPGGGVSRRYLRAAVVLPPRRVVTGVSVSLSYTIIGGQFKTSP